MSTHFTDDVVKDHTAKGDNVIDPLVPRYMMATKTKEIIIDSDTKNIINDKISKISPRTTGKTSSTFNELPRYMQPTKALTSKFDRGHVEGKMPIKPRMKAIIHAPKVTIPQPFHFRSDERAHGRERQVQRSREIDKDSGRNQTIKKHKSVDLDECKKQFSAMKMPSFSTPSIIVNKKTLIKQNRTIVPTTSSYGKKNNTNNTLNSGDKPFHLRCLERHDALQNELKVSRELKEKQERHQNFFRARPMPDSSKVYNVKKSDNPRVVSEKTNALNSGKNATKLRQQLRRKDPRQGKYLLKTFYILSNLSNYSPDLLHLI